MAWSAPVRSSSASSSSSRALPSSLSPRHRVREPTSSYHMLFVFRDGGLRRWSSSYPPASGYECTPHHGRTLRNLEGISPAVYVGDIEIPPSLVPLSGIPACCDWFSRPGGGPFRWTLGAEHPYTPVSSNAQISGSLILIHLRTWLGRSPSLSNRGIGNYRVAQSTICLGCEIPGGPQSPVRCL